MRRCGKGDVIHVYIWRHHEELKKQFYSKNVEDEARCLGRLKQSKIIHDYNKNFISLVLKTPNVSNKILPSI